VSPLSGTRKKHLFLSSARNYLFGLVGGNVSLIEFYPTFLKDNCSTMTSQAANKKTSPVPPASSSSSHPTMPSSGGGTKNNGGPSSSSSGMQGQTSSSQRPTDGGDSANRSPSQGNKSHSTIEPTDEMVMSYLRKQGMGSAVLELTKILKDRNPKQHPPSSRVQMEIDEANARNQRSLLARATGGGFGYDVDGAPSIVQWGVPDGRIDGEDGDGDEQKNDGDTAGKKETEDAQNKSGSTLKKRMGRDEARAYLDSFAALQTWILSLPDDPAATSKTQKPNKEGVSASQKVGSCGISIASVVKHTSERTKLPISDEIKSSVRALEQTEEDMSSLMPASVKPELLAVAFALLVHTHCELLEVGMETKAKHLLMTFRNIYEPLYQDEMADLDKCTTTDEIIKLNSNNSSYLESLATLKAIMVQVTNYQTKKASLVQELSNHNSSGPASTATQLKKKIAEYDSNIALLQQKYDETTKRAETAFERTQDLPFLRRARAIRWQLTLSATSYGMLASFLASKEVFLPMSTLLQTKCEIHVERRDPLPYTPSCILDDGKNGDKATKDKANDLRWAAPVAPTARLSESGEKVDGPGMLEEAELLPFPKYHLEEEYDSKEKADAAKSAVEFNRALLVNGFRRLEALERKRDYDMGLRRLPDEKSKAESPATATTAPSEESPHVMANPLEPSILLSTLCSSSSTGSVIAKTSSRPMAIDASAIWEESGVGITSAKMCPVDGRRVAAGCDDAAIRIWSVFGSEADQKNNNGDSNGGKDTSDEVSETAMVLLGHKNGFPVFDVDWNRDGRTLLSAGGDGSVRLWDTMAKGPYGKVSKDPKGQKAKGAPEDSIVPGFRTETNEDISGAALAVYRGHMPSAPVWSVSFAPSGYYFASAGADGTARLWTTDRPAPVRVFAGHVSPSVNCVTWHPNCNYVLTGADDKTIRMWDILSGNCVRLLDGCSQGINVVTVSPSGRYAAGADYSGIISIWDLGSGRKVNELRPPPLEATTAGSKRSSSGTLRLASDPRSIHALCYSACGTALASGGDDGTVRIWDVRGAANNMSNPTFAAKQGWGETSAAVEMSTRQLNNSRQPQQLMGVKNRPGTLTPVKSFGTRRTLIMDLQYTKRNLLLSVGKYAASLPTVVPNTD